MPKCPVCKSEVHPGSKECCICGFTDLNAEFLNIEEAEIWQKQVVEPCKAIWQRSAQNKYRKMGKFEVVGTTLIKYNYNHLEADSLILIPYGITTISSWAFNSVRAGYVILPNTVTTIENFAFGNSIIEHLYIPSSVAHIGMFAVGNREGTNVYLDFTAPNPNWGDSKGGKFGFNRPAEWGSPFYDWNKFKRYVDNSDFSHIHDNVRCFWKNEWVDLLHNPDVSVENPVCLPSKKELVIDKPYGIAIVYNGYFIGDVEQVYDEDGDEIHLSTIEISLLINNITHQPITITATSFEGMDLEASEQAIVIEPNTVKECWLQYSAQDEDDNDRILDLDTGFPETPGLRFSFDMSIANGRNLHYDCDFSRLNNINAPGKGMNIEDLEKAKKQKYSL